MGLAGNKVKQRINDDPRNLKWANDKDGLGYQLLCGMGWSEGKGLGSNEDGMKEHVKVAKKDDSLGCVGATKKTVDNWLENNDAFNQILASLASSTPEAPEKKKDKKKKKEKGESSENKEEVPVEKKHRMLHRKKYLEAKKKVFESSTDLSAVLGVKQTAKELPEEQSKSVIVTKDQTFAFKHANMSTNDYFKMKMEKFQSSLNGVAVVNNSETEQKQETSDKEGEVSSKKKDKKRKLKEDDEEEAPKKDENKKKKDKSKKKSKREPESEETETCDKAETEKLKKKKKEKRE
ncbi:hypothetical protein MP638_005969 [Amoeboaphelidium occidentale]|nr:hypothetical protein MP638_005969 [Amoeboaphelidium occidentale]